MGKRQIMKLNSITISSYQKKKTFDETRRALPHPPKRTSKVTPSHHITSSYRHQLINPHHPSLNLLGDANNAASRTTASVASLLALLVAALAEVVGAGVHDDGAAQHALRADQLDVLVGHAARGVALAVGLEVAKVADVALGVGGGAVGLVVRVDFWGLLAAGFGGRGRRGMGTHSEGRRWCSRWCCRRRCGCACRARRWRRCRRRSS